MSKFIITYTPYFLKSLLKELTSLDEKMKLIKKIDNGISLIDVSISKREFTDKLIEHPPIFLKHIMPVDHEGFISGYLETDKEEILKNCLNICSIDENDLFAVQSRIVNATINYSSKDLEVFIGTNYEKKGSIPCFSDTSLKNTDVKIISIFINDNSYYLGYSTSKENLNYHCDEYRLLSKNGREISRAENKLKEALSKFEIKLTKEGIALDIGAAPGGWTKVLADYGYIVYAVDPGNLKEELNNNPNIKHYKCRIESLKFENTFDIIVNDMNVDPQITAEIMNSLAPSLKEGGLAIVTFKLPGKIEETIKEAKEILSKEYQILKMNSLFHNRQEITVLIKKNI